MRWRLVDRITGFTPWKTISGVKTASFEEYCLLEPLGIRGRLPETLVIGAFAELACWLVAASTGFERACLLSGVEEFKLDGAVMGSSLELGMEVTGSTDTELRARCTLSDRGRPSGSGSLIFDMVSHRALYDAESRAILWRELYGEA